MLRSVLLLALVATFVAGCQTLREVASLRFVDFAIDRVSDARLAGVDVSRIQSYEQLTPQDVLRIGAAVADGRMPLSFRLHVLAENPADNPVAARLVEMDWTLFLQDRQTVSGAFEGEVVMQPGQTVDIPIRIEVDLRRCFEDNMRDLVELALATTGQGGRPTAIRLEATPTIRTAVGPIRYPQPITIVHREISGNP